MSSYYKDMDLVPEVRENNIRAIYKENTKLKEDNKNLLKLCQLRNVGGLRDENEKLRECIGSLVHTFHDYGMEEESFLLLMEVEKAEQCLRELDERTEES